MQSHILSRLVIALLLASTVFCHSEPWAFEPSQLVAVARKQVGVTVGYDPEYRVLSYPGGDVSQETGVCCDVVIRAMRGLSIDLQKEVHEDMTAHFAKYPRNWGLSKPDKNIDHRRVPNLMTFFKRRGCEIPISTKPNDYRLGDVVTCMVGGSLPHIFIISDRRAADGTPLVIHNIGRGAQEEDILFQYPITGHYRLGNGSAGK